MSSRQIAISARGLGKSYRVVDLAQRATTLGEALSHWIRNPLAPSPRRAFQALSDVTFEIQTGEVVGIIGRNGAGKSTLLKILSRITAPTTGTADLFGRVGSLLEVGTGFHPELTGRENIFLNGGILGMTRREIARHFDAIVDFAGVEDFLETPVKRYSSGMYVRLAFAVAAHLDPEILIVDEVLAVGDAQFQKKCLGKMNETAKSGRTVIFVSHNMGTVQALCPRAMLLRQGQIVMDGPTDQVVDLYLSALEEEGGLGADLSQRPGNGDVEITDVRVVDGSGQVVAAVVGGDDVTLQIDYRNHGGCRHATITANLYDDRARPLTSFSTPLTSPDFGHLAPYGRFVCQFPRLALLPGRYRVALALHADGMTADTLKAAVTFQVASTLFYETGAAPSSSQASFLVDHKWQHEPLSQEPATHTQPPLAATTSGS